MSRKVRLMRPDGTVVQVPEDKVGVLKTLGYRDVTSGEEAAQAKKAGDEEYYTSASQRALAGAEGLARGATLGASDLVLDVAGADTAKRAASNPGVGLVGEIVGAVATGGLGLAKGAVGVLARLTPSGAVAAGATRLAERRLGVGLASKVAGGAVEGAASGVGGEISHSVLSGDPLTVEGMVAGAGIGSLFGAGAGALAHGMTKAADYRAGRGVEGMFDQNLGTDARAMAYHGEMTGPPGRGLPGVEDPVARTQVLPGLPDQDVESLTLLQGQRTLDMYEAQAAAGPYQGPAPTRRVPGMAPDDTEGLILAQGDRTADLYERQIAGGPYQGPGPVRRVPGTEVVSPDAVAQAGRAIPDEAFGSLNRALDDARDGVKREIYEAEVRGASGGEDLFTRYQRLSHAGTEAEGVAALGAGADAGKGLRRVVGANQRVRDLFDRGAGADDISRALDEYETAVRELGSEVGADVSRTLDGYRTVEWSPDDVRAGVGGQLEGLDPKRLARVRAGLEQGLDLDQIAGSVPEVADLGGGRYEVVSGRHRLQAGADLGRKSRVRVSPGALGEMPGQGASWDELSAYGQRVLERTEVSAMAQAEAFAEAADFGAEGGRGLVSYRNRVKALWNSANKAAGKGDPAKAAEAVQKYREAVQELADVTGLAGKQAKAPDALLEYQAALGKARAGAPVDGADFLSWRQDKLETWTAAVDQALAKGQGPGVEALRKAVDDLVRATGLDSSLPGATAGTRLRAAWAGGRSAGTPEAAGALGFVDVPRKVREPIDLPPEPGISGFESAPRDLPGPVDVPDAPGISGFEAAPRGKRAAVDVPEVEGEFEVQSGGPSLKQVKESRSRGGPSLGGAASVVAGDLIFGRTLAQAGKHAARNTAIGLLMGGWGAAADAVKGAALRVLGNRTLAKATRVALPRGWGLYQSLTGRRDPEADMRAAFRARSDEIRELGVTGRDRLYAALEPLLADGHSEFAAEAYQVGVRALDQLMSRVPKTPPGTRWGVDYLWEAPDEQVEVFSQEYAAITNPVQFLTFAADTPEQAHPTAVQALRKTYPALYAEFQVRALEALAQAGTRDMTADRLTALSVVLDVPLNPTITPEFQQDHQALFLSQAQPAQPKPTPPAGRPPGGGEMTAAQNLAMR